MINSADEFVRLRQSEDPDEYHRAAWEEADVDVWREVMRAYPDMLEWVAHNKSIPEVIIRELYRLGDKKVNDTLARKRKTPLDILEEFAHSSDESLRLSVARHPKAPRSVLMMLQSDDWVEVRKVVNERLEKDDD
ncbi:MAG: hypothetical protein P8M30_15540 [Planctomycetaceae bacterium]|jgi:hypothetical protein|nr:hypothetical protein [Planctomycetaceae bacterium]